ncbi:hypothetical protein D9615_002950 [Tricholomella constricta]|uniref:Sas10 C-terminal domain-containing protein n=1 Tax=Tricholomella constricta TaxID=117010 RepID=A0A8H5M6G5_9AGAR|nr:hypothetical protein D9615_002950 [Tricholomella constricta]
MPRRRSTKTRSHTGKARPVNRADAKVTKWNRASDVPMDEEDLFHASRDKVLLDGDNNYEDDGDDDEVFALKGLDEEEDEEVDVVMDEDEEERALEEEKTSRKKGKDDISKKKKKKNAESSEEEESEDEEETWGRSKSAWYSSNAAQLESDDEEGNELEEQEAKRLQSKMREEMEDADFGLDDALDVEGVQETNELAEPMPVVVEPLPQDKKLLLRHLEKTSPEALALARDWEDTVEALAKTQQKLAKLEAENPDALSLGMIHIYYQALLTYTTTLAFYLHLRSSAKYAQRPELLKSHPILRRLLTLKQSLTTLEDLDFDASDSEDDEDDEEDDNLNMTWNEIMADGESIWDTNDDVAMDDDELRLLLEEASSQKSKRPQQEPPRKKRKASSNSEVTKPTPVFDLVEPEFAPSKPSSSYVSADSAMADTYGETTSLQHADVADKTARKKSLRFHTSRIESTSARRQGARNQAVGGDDDLPYRERKKDKDARLAKESTKLRGQGGEDLDDTEPEPKPAKRRLDEDGDNDEPEGPDGYYELVKKKTKEKKEQKKAEYEAMQESVRPDFNEVDATGPRSLTRAILANKGLTPHRPKSVRNPRVKKRLKFEKAKKKLSSQKAVYKGGLADSGRYDGEKTGISKVIKSVRLG